MSIVSIESIRIPKHVKCLPSKINETMNRFQQKAIYHNGELDFLKSTEPIRLSDNELDELKHRSKLNPLTYKATLALADQYNDPKISEDTRLLVNENLNRRLELQRIGILGVSLLGFFLPMVALQQPIEHIIPAYTAATILYISLGCINMWKNRNNAGEADVRLAKKMTELSSKKNSLLDSRSEKQFDPESLQAAINTEYIQELWGLGPELATILAMSVTGHPLVAIANLGVMGVFRGIRSIIVKNQSSIDSLHKEVPQIVVSVILRNILNLIAIYTSQFMSTPELVAALTIATTQIAGSEIVAATYKTQRPGSEAIYRSFNQMLAQTISRNSKPDAIKNIRFYEKHPKLHEYAQRIFEIFNNILAFEEVNKKYFVLDAFVDLMKRVYIPQLKQLEEAYHESDELLIILKEEENSLMLTQRRAQELDYLIDLIEKKLELVNNQITQSEKNITDESNYIMKTEKTALSSLQKSTKYILDAQAYFLNNYNFDLGITIDKSGLLTFPNKEYFKNASPELKLKIAGLLKYLGDISHFEQPVQIIFPDDNHFFKTKPKINVSIVPPHGACTNDCQFCDPTTLSNHGDPGDSFLLKKKFLTDEYISGLKRILSLDIEPDEIVISGLGEPLLSINSVVDFVTKVKAEFKDNPLPIRLNTDGQASISTKESARKIAKRLADSGLDTVAISVNAVKKADYEELCRPKNKGAYDDMVSFIKECVRDGRMKVLLSFVDYSEQEPNWPKINKEEILKFAKKLGLGEENILIRPYMY